MIVFYESLTKSIYAVESSQMLTEEEHKRLRWLFGNANLLNQNSLSGEYIGPRREMVTPWSTNAVEITQNMGIEGILRIEEFFPDVPGASYDLMLQAKYSQLDQKLFSIDKLPEPIFFVEDISHYNHEEGLALSDEEIEFLEKVCKELKRPLTDSEVFGFSQVNSEHCRHKIFNGSFEIDGNNKPHSLFALIKETSRQHPNRLVSAYKDNVAFVKGPQIEQFAPSSQDRPDYFQTRKINSVLSLKAETHNFPTTVEPFNGAATGTGGEIRDRMAGGKGSIPLAGTAVYMTAYPRLNGKKAWEERIQPREWLYQSPVEILIKASNGASDFGNKFGQPLICGSLLTFEHEENQKLYSYDKVIMLAGGIGYGKASDSQKEIPAKSDKIVVMGGDNYRIGMGGGAVSSVATGEFQKMIELNAVQRSNPEMQKRVANVIRALTEDMDNPIISIHDHGAGGHLNCLSELAAPTGGHIYLRKLPLGDPTLSAKEIIGNESQERMGLLIKEKHLHHLEAIAERERAPMYVVGEITGDNAFKIADEKSEKNPIDWKLRHMFESSPHTTLKDKAVPWSWSDIPYDVVNLKGYLIDILQLESVASKDWLTNKVDRSVTGKVAKQQTAGSIQLPLNDVAVTALDFQGKKGVATSIGHAPAVGLINAAAGSRLAVAEALTNLVWAPLDHGLPAVSLSANWMWPAKNPGEDARLYEAVEGMSEFCIELGINIPTGKDSLSMTQKYEDGNKVFSPGTVIISTVAEVTDIRKVVEPVLAPVPESKLVYVDFSGGEFLLGGSGFAQIRSKVGKRHPDVEPGVLKNAFSAVQQLVNDEKILAGHDISSGGMIVTLLEMAFANTNTGMELHLSDLTAPDLIALLFSEKPGVIIQVADLDHLKDTMQTRDVKYEIIGGITYDQQLKLHYKNERHNFSIEELRDYWYNTSYLLDKHQCNEGLAKLRYEHYKLQKLEYKFSDSFTGKSKDYGLRIKNAGHSGIRAAIIREKGVNGDREMAYALYLAGFDVKDVHMTDLKSGKETLEDIQLIVFVGGFSNSDVLGSAKGWAGAFLFNPPAKSALDNFYKKTDTLSLGVCNGCQLMAELGLIYPEHPEHPRLLPNTSGKFESAFLNVEILENDSVMLGSLSGSRLGIWVAHGEGRFSFPKTEHKYNIAMKYSYDLYPGNPNGSDFNAACMVSPDGRHLAVMPHLERSIFPWQWAHYREDRKNDQITPWMEAFANARRWIYDRG